MDGVFVQLLRLHSDVFVLKDVGEGSVGILAANLPRVEERLPIDVLEQALDVVIV